MLINNKRNLRNYMKFATIFDKQKIKRIVMHYILVGLISIIAISSNAQTMQVPPGSNLSTFIAGNSAAIYELNTGVYYSGATIWNHGITIKRATPSSIPVIRSILTLAGDNIVVDGLKWDDDSNINDLDRAIEVEGTGNTIKNCTFFGFSEQTGEAVIIGIGITSDAKGGGNTLVENCTFRKWGTRNTLHLEGDDRNVVSMCIGIGRVNERNAIQGVVIRNNKFLEGPRYEYGYNPAIQSFGSVLIEYNEFDVGSECTEFKADNITFRYNTINKYSGYKILANRIGRNHLFEFNLVTNCLKVPEKPDVSTQAIFAWDGGNHVWRNNIIYNCEAIGYINGKQFPGQTPLTNLLIANNTFVNNLRSFSFSEGNGPAEGVGFVNNIFYNDIFPTYDPFYTYDIGYDWKTSINNMNSNLFFNFKVPDNSVNHQTSNPGFTNIGTDFSILNSTSPAVDNGYALNTTAALVDFVGVIRPTDGNGDGTSKYDIGAYEYFDPLQTKVYCSGSPNIIFENQTIPTDNYTNRILITARDNAVVSNGGNVLFESILGINLYPGFEVENGATFEARTRLGCTHIIGYKNQNYGSNSRNSGESNLNDSLSYHKVLSTKKEEPSNNIIVYPNPANKTINIGLVGVSSKPIRLMIYDLNGKLTLSKEFDNGGLRVFEGIDVSNYKPGVYMVKMETKEGYIYKKIVIE